MEKQSYNLKRKVLLGLLPFVLVIIPFILYSHLYGENKLLTNFEVIGYEMDGGVYKIENASTVELLIETEYQESMTIGYLEINGEIYRFNKKEITCFNEECTKVTVSYKLREEDTVLKLENVKLYNRGLLYLGSTLDLDSKNEIELDIID